MGGGRRAESLFWTCLRLKMSTWFSSAVPVSQALTQTAGLTTGVFMYVCVCVRVCVRACVLWSQTASTAAGLSARSAHASGFKQDLAARNAFVVLSDPSRFNKTSGAGPLSVSLGLSLLFLSECNLTLSTAPHFIITHIISPLNN